ncbi:hypothetical protein [Staphylococcus xylosus]
MKIKTKKQLNLPQLIEWGFENDVKNECFLTHDSEGNTSEVHFDITGLPKFSSMVDKSDTFTIEVEETLTIDTVFPSLAVVRKQHFASGNSTVHVTKINNKSIRSLIGKQPINSTFEYKEVYLMDDDKLGQCIWRDGKLVE